MGTKAIRLTIVLLNSVVLTSSAMGTSLWNVQTIASESRGTLSSNSLQMNAQGRVVWSQYDGHDMEIYSWHAGTPAQITNDEVCSDNPMIANNGDIAWLNVSPRGDNYRELWKRDSTAYIVAEFLPRDPVRMNASGQLAWSDEGMNIYFWNNTQPTYVAFDGSAHHLPHVPFLNDKGAMVWRENQTDYGQGWAAEIADSDGIYTHSLRHYISDFNNSEQILSHQRYNYSSNDLAPANLHLWTNKQSALIWSASQPGIPLAAQLNDSGHVSWIFDGVLYFWNGTETIVVDQFLQDKSDIAYLSDNDTIAYGKGTELFFWDGNTSHVVCSSLAEYNTLIMNNSHQIAWLGSDQNGSAVFFAEPVPEPCALAFFVFGVFLTRLRQIPA